MQSQQTPNNSNKIRGINGNPYIGFDNQLSLKELQGLHYKICWGIAKSKSYRGTLLELYHAHSRWMSGDATDESLARAANAAEARIYEVGKQVLPEWIQDKQIKELYDSLLNREEKKKFEEIALGAYRSGEYVVLRFTKPESKDPFGTFKRSECFTTADAENFPELMSWIHKLPFLEIGRILIFVNDGNKLGELHYDRRDDWYTGEYHFLHLNPNLRKPFFICGDDMSEMARVKHRAIFFNMADLHGSWPSIDATYTLRVDGQFTREFAEANGIKWKQR